MKKLLTALVVSLSLLSTPSLAIHGGNNEVPPTVETYEALNLFGEIFNQIRKNHVDAQDDTKLIEEAIRGMIKSLDKHSSYLTSDGFSRMRESTSGRYFGIGAEVAWDEDKKAVIMVIPMDGSPAEKAGIMSGDLVIEIDGEKTSEIGNLNDAVGKIKGPNKTKVVLTVVRKGEEKPIKITVTRGGIQQQIVRSRMLKGSIMYVRLIQFSVQSSIDMTIAIKKMIANVGVDNLDGLIFDLRNNPGGLLPQAIEVSDMFLDKGMIVETRTRNGEHNIAVFAMEGQVVPADLPIIILINKGSASASEIVAGTLKDLGRATIVGVQSFGKGSVQTIMPLFNGGALRLTTAKYYTAGGTTPHGIGITPDVVVELPENYWKDIPHAERRTHIDPQLQKAIDILIRDLSGDVIIPGPTDCRENAC